MARDRVYILAANVHQARIWAEQWAAAVPGRRLMDAVYLHDSLRLKGLGRRATVVELPGAYLHPKWRWLRRDLSGQGIEPVAADHLLTAVAAPSHALPLPDESSPTQEAGPCRTT